MNITTRLTVYKNRLNEATDPQTRAFYQAEIEDMESDIAVDRLLYELNFVPPNIVETDQYTTVQKLMKNDHVLKVTHFFKWRRLKFMWRVELYYSSISEF